MFAPVGSKRGFRLGCPQELGEGGPGLSDEAHLLLREDKDNGVG